MLVVAALNQNYLESSWL